MRSRAAWWLAGALVLGACATEDAPAAGTSSDASSGAPAVTEAPAATAAPVPTGSEAVPEAPVAPEEPTGPTPWTEAIDAYDFEGAPDRDAAMALFSMAMGPIEGFPEPPAEPGIVGGSLTVAFRALMSVWDELSDAEKAAAISAARGGDAGYGFVRGAGADQLLAVYQDLVALMRGRIAGHIGDFSGDIEVIIAKKDDKANDYAITTPDMLTDGKFTGDCTITFFPRTTSATSAEIANTVAHEVFHCFQLAALGDVYADGRAPGWVIEGGAEWVGGVVAGPDASTPGRWRNWFRNAALPLAIKSYSAIGFWSHLDEVGTSPWSVFRAVWAAGATPAAWVAAGAESPAFLDSWASGMTRRSGFPPGWDTTGPGITGDTIAVEQVDVAAPGQQAVTTAPYTTAAYDVNSTADVLVFTGTGHVRVSDGIVDVIATSGSRFCHRPGGCECPEAAKDDVPPAPIGKPTVALSAGATGSSATIIGLTLEEDCKEREKRAVQVVADRPASDGVLAGRVLELTSCNGAYGDWSGVLRLGGLSLNGFEVPFQEIPIQFTVGGTGVRTVQAAAGGVIQTPAFDLSVNYDLAITINNGETMSITGTAAGDTDMFSVAGGFPSQLSELPIEDAPEGVCPDT